MRIRNVKKFCKSLGSVLPNGGCKPSNVHHLFTNFSTKLNKTLDNEGVLSIISAKTPSWVAIGRENERWLFLTTWCFLFVKNRGNLIVEFLDAHPSVIKKMEGMDHFTKGEYAANILEKTKLGVRIEEMVETLERFRYVIKNPLLKR